MQDSASQGQDAVYRSLPKVDLHRHLEGSLRLETLIEIARKHDLALPAASLADLVQIGRGEPYTHANFLSKFRTLREFFRSPDVIARITQEAVADAAADHVRYLELRFTPVALSRAGGFAMADVMDWVLDSARQASAAFGVTTRLIASTNRHESPDLAAQVAQLAADRQDRGLVGLDLAGDEANFSAAPFAGLFREARQAGLHLTIHAGEWAGADNVVEAIHQLQAERIGHGVRVLDQANAVKLARETGTTFEVCLTSNYQSGVIPSLDRHPLLRMLAEGLAVTINTDDPSISQITLSDEYRVACAHLGLSLSDLKARVLCAARAAFLPSEERAPLIAALEAAWPS